MAEIYLNNEKLDMEPGVKVDIERNSPYTQLTDEITGDYSLPFPIKGTEKNMRLTGYQHLIQNNNGQAQPCTILDDGVFFSSGKLRVQQVQHDLNHPGRTVASAYYLSAISAFYQDIKGLKMPAVNYGGDIVKTWDNFNEAGSGFWGHIHAVLNSSPGYGIGVYNYAFYSVYDPIWGENPDTGDMIPQVINHTEEVAGVLKFKHNSYGDQPPFAASVSPNIIVPFPYLMFVMEKCAAHVGWRISWNITEEFDMRRITLINFRAIYWGYTQTTGGPLIEGTSPIVFNMNQHVPDMLVSEFFAAVKTRLGIFYEFDNARKIITISDVDALKAGDVKDVSRSVVNPVVKERKEDASIIALRVSANGYLDRIRQKINPDTYQGELDTPGDLPTAAETNEGHTYLVRMVNAYYICVEYDTDLYEWQYFTPNIYDYEPDGYTQEITTSALVPPMDYLNSYYDLIPKFENEGGQYFFENSNSWPILLCYWHGKRENIAGQLTSYGSHHIYDSNMVQVANVALSFLCRDVNGDEVGIWAFRYKPLLEMINLDEYLKFSLVISKLDLYNLKFTDKLIIRGVPVIIDKIFPQLPYPGIVQIHGYRGKL